MLIFREVHKRFGPTPVLRGVSFAVREGEMHFVLGKSGAGKSVLIKQVVGLLAADAGSIRLEGRELVGLDEAGFGEVRRVCQMVFQSATLFDGLTLLENVAMPLRKRFGLSKREAAARAAATLAVVRVDDLATRLPADVGRGVQKRVAIARALALAPRVLLYDEPTTGLDPVAARRTDRLIRDTTDRDGVTSLVVSHDLASVRLADRVTFLHDGRVAFSGTPSELLACDVQEVHRFVHGERPRSVRR